MTRIQSTAKQGYYPTDTKALPLIASYFAPASTGRLLDPQAGEGVALKALADAWGLAPYANELDPERAAACIRLFGSKQAMRGDMYALRASNEAFSALWLNPLYGDNVSGTDRQEFAALKHAWKWLQPGGYMLWTVYRPHMTERVCGWLATRITEATILNYPGLHMDAYQQILLVVRAGQPNDSTQMFLTLSQLPSEPLSLQSAPRWQFPPAVAVKEFKFIPEIVPPDLAFQILRDSPDSVHQSQSWQNLTAIPPKLDASVHPAIMPRGRQLAMVLMAGTANGLFITDPELGKAAMRAVTIPEESKVREDVQGDGTPENTTKREVFRTKPHTILTLLTPDGRTKTMEGEAAIIPFIRQQQAALVAALKQRVQPVYDFQPGALAKPLSEVRIKRNNLYPVQKHVIAAAERVLRQRKGLILVGEMGTGKTIMGASLMKVMLPKRKPGQVALIMCPSHLVEKWQEELPCAVPQAEIRVLDKIGQVREFMAHAAAYPSRPHIGIMSKEMAKLGEGFSPAYVTKRTYTAHWKHSHPRPDTFNENAQRCTTSTNLACPDCGNVLWAKIDGVDQLVDKAYLERAPRNCDHCGAPLWQDKRTFSAPKEAMTLSKWLSLTDGHTFDPRSVSAQPKPPRIALADYISRYYKDRLYLYLVDEIHEAKDASSGQGSAMTTLANTATKVVGLTGTIFGGTASSLFYLAFTFSPRLRKHFPWKGGLQAWVNTMGIMERAVETRPTFDPQSGKFTGTRQIDIPPREAPGCTPALVSEILDYCLFLSLKDIGAELPPYTEIPVAVKLPADVAQEYSDRDLDMKQYLAACRKEKDPTFLSAYLQATLNWPDAAFETEPVVHNKTTLVGRKKVKTAHTVTTFKGFDPQRIYPKEAELIRLVRDANDAGRGVAIFLRQTGDKRNLAPRLENLLRVHIPLLKPYVLPASITPRKRDATIKSKVKAGVNCLICNPELVKTGLDLLAFPTIIVYEPTYSLYTTIQAVHRAWRLNQKADCTTYFLYYQDVMEQRAIRLIARKIQAAALLTGDLTAEGLSDLADESNSLLEELAASLDGAEDLTDLTALFQQNNETGDLRESAWYVEPEEAAPAAPPVAALAEASSETSETPAQTAEATPATTEAAVIVQEVQAGAVVSEVQEPPRKKPIRKPRGRDEVSHRPLQDPDDDDILYCDACGQQCDPIEYHFGLCKWFCADCYKTEDTRYQANRPPAPPQEKIKLPAVPCDDCGCTNVRLQRDDKNRVRLCPTCMAKPKHPRRCDGCGEVTKQAHRSHASKRMLCPKCEEKEITDKGAKTKRKVVTKTCSKCGAETTNPWYLGPEGSLILCTPCREKLDAERKARDAAKAEAQAQAKPDPVQQKIAAGQLTLF